jgi:histidine ammonia-lyase
MAHHTITNFTQFFIPQNQLDSTIAPIQIASALLQSDMKTTTHPKPITHNSS